MNIENTKTLADIADMLHSEIEAREQTEQNGLVSRLKRFDKNIGNEAGPQHKKIRFGLVSTLTSAMVAIPTICLMGETTAAYLTLGIAGALGFAGTGTIYYAAHQIMNMKPAETALSVGEYAAYKASLNCIGRGWRVGRLEAKDSETFTFSDGIKCDQRPIATTYIRPLKEGKVLSPEEVKGLEFMTEIYAYNVYEPDEKRGPGKERMPTFITGNFMGCSELNGSPLLRLDLNGNIISLKYTGTNYIIGKLNDYKR